MSTATQTIHKKNPIYPNSFNLLDEGRKFGSNQRKYVIETAMSAVNGEQAQERMKLGEAYGFYGHGVRKKVGRPNVGDEYLDNTGKIVAIIPNARTVSAHVSDDGTMVHEQEIFLDTDFGKVINGFIESKVGGWSWAATPRADSTPLKNRVKDFFGMDYVGIPNFSANRSYDMMLDSAYEQSELLQALLANKVEEEVAKKVIEDICAPETLYDQLQTMEDDLFAFGANEAELSMLLRENEVDSKAVKQFFDNAGQLLSQFGLPGLNAGDSVDQNLTSFLSMVKSRLENPHFSSTLPLVGNEQLLDGLEFTIPKGKSEKKAEPSIKPFLNVQVS